MSDATSSFEELRASDGATLSAYRARPRDKARGGVVVVQEIFGVNSHIRQVAETYAAHGYDVIAPALFDRVQRGLELGYGADGMQKGRAIVTELGVDKPLLDIAAAVQTLAASGHKVGVVGYCWGGALSFLAAARVDGLAAAVGYYGTAIARFTNETPRVPLMLHFGTKDRTLPPETVETIRNARPEATYYLYEADHGFNCDQRGSHDAPSAELALRRTLDFFTQHLS
jgi:carboxymethylenebutenolidase